MFHFFCRGLRDRERQRKRERERDRERHRERERVTERVRERHQLLYTCLNAGAAGVA